MTDIDIFILYSYIKTTYSEDNSVSISNQNVKNLNDLRYLAFGHLIREAEVYNPTNKTDYCIQFIHTDILFKHPICDRSDVFFTSGHLLH